MKRIEEIKNKAAFSFRPFCLVIALKKRERKEGSERENAWKNALCDIARGGEVFDKNIKRIWKGNEGKINFGFSFVISEPEKNNAPKNGKNIPIRAKRHKGAGRDGEKAQNRIFDFCLGGNGGEREEKRENHIEDRRRCDSFPVHNIPGVLRNRGEESESEKIFSEASCVKKALRDEKAHNGRGHSSEDVKELWNRGVKRKKCPGDVVKEHRENRDIFYEVASEAFFCQKAFPPFADVGGQTVRFASL